MEKDYKKATTASIACLPLAFSCCYLSGCRFVSFSKQIVRGWLVKELPSFNPSIHKSGICGARCFLYLFHLHCHFIKEKCCFSSVGSEKWVMYCSVYWLSKVLETDCWKRQCSLPAAKYVWKLYSSLLRWF